MYIGKTQGLAFDNLGSLSAKKSRNSKLSNMEWRSICN